jgi:GNAT superfamily N-acetyltransferase
VSRRTILTGALSIVRELVRGRGFRFTLRRAWGLYAWGEDRVVIVEHLFTGRALEPGSDSITFGRAAAKDLAELPLLARRRAARILPLLEQGNCWLHVARDGDRLVGYRFATQGYWGHGVLAKVIRPAADQVYIEDIFVHPDYRGRNIAGRLVVAQNFDLMAFGIRGALGSVSVDNIASLRMRRDGARPILFLDSRRRLFYHRCTVSPTMPPDIQRILDEVGS